MGKKRILVIEDEPEAVEMLKMRLEANRYEVISAADGEEGLKKAKAYKPDLILLDIMMPNMDGFTFVRESKKDEVLRRIPIVVVTAKPEMEDLFELEDIKDYIVKPFDDRDLLEKIAKNLSG